MNRSICSFILFFYLSLLGAQVSYTANDTLVPYGGHFRPGSNIGEYPPFSDDQLAELAAGNPSLHIDGVGVKAIRPGLFEDFFEQYGYESRLSTYALYDSLGLKDNTLIVGFPSETHQDPVEYCPGNQSTLFANMYEAIWDNGENGTPVNDDNYYALYLYKTATLYKDYIKFWEIWNEPGFDYTEATGFLPPGEPGNWWENNPDPCDYKLRAPIFHYVRLLRISYEVIKSVDPEAYITVSGVGYPSFLDAILRNTDNPLDGSVSAEYPLRGGAYFDVMGYHSYPHFDGSLRYWDNTIMDFVYERHSDAAVDGLLAQQDTFQTLLSDYGYNGLTYPEKLWIVTEVNLPRKPFGEYIGSAEAQRNFMIKSIVACIKNNFVQFHIYKLAEDKSYEDAGSEFDLMGLYKKLNFSADAYQEVNDEGIAYRTASELLFENSYDPQRTTDLALPDGVRGGAFYDENGNYTYVLWAETSIDNSELASASFSFPANFEFQQLIQRNWDYSETGTRTLVDPSNIALTGTPVFLTKMHFSANQYEGCAPMTVIFTDESPSETVFRVWDFEGGNPGTSSSTVPLVEFASPGTHEVRLRSYDADQNLIAEQHDVIVVHEATQAAFSATVTGPLVMFHNESSTNTDQFLWDFGDGTTSTSPNPQHLYLESGTYEVVLTTSNFCGNQSTNQTYTITAPGPSQLASTAHEEITPHTGTFRPGTNIKFYDPWTDEQLADIAAGNHLENVKGAGVRSMRTILPQYFLDFWGYDIRVSTFEHYNNRDLRDNVVTIGFPSSTVQDTLEFCPGVQSTLFEGLYVDIWDNGENGTPVNENNPFATYLYHTVNTYKDYVRFWEILDSPDFDPSGEKGWLPPGEQGNWWENNPDPCDNVLRAPIFYYIRMLRISYEIIKTQDPDGYVTLAGLGFPSYLDAILRNTDNPIDGSPVAGYEKTGGAYFDAIGFNSFPHFDGSTIYYDVNAGGFVYERHSDAASAGIGKSKAKFESVLQGRGYDGTTYPEKLWIVSQGNIPRKQFGESIGSEQAQRNFIIKAWIESIKNDIKQFHVYRLGEDQFFADATTEFEAMGLYQKLEGVAPYNQSYTGEGIAHKTTSDLLFGTDYDGTRTEALELSDSIDGAAFVDGEGKYTYVLWAKTMVDQSEFASAIYTFPPNLGIGQLYQKAWDYAQTGENTLIAPDNILLTGAPVFLTEAEEPLLPPLADINSAIQAGCPPLEVQFSDASLRAETWLWTFPGGTPQTSIAQNPTVIYNTPGQYDVFLEVSNAAGSHTAVFSEYISVDSLPAADFTFEYDHPYVNFTNASVNATSYIWHFGDNSTSFGFNPSHYYFNNGTYEVMLVAVNDCGSDTIVREVILDGPPIADFNATVVSDCAPYNVLLQDLSPSSPTAWTWLLPGSDTPVSNEANPFVTYALPGIYEVTLIVSNENGNDTLIQVLEIDPDLVFTYSDALCEDENVVINGTVYDVNSPEGTEILPGGGVGACDSVVIVELTFYQNYLFEDSLAVCEGGGFENDTTIVESFLTGFGCDSILIFHVSVVETYEAQFQKEICSGDSIAGIPYFQDTQVTEVYQSIHGCDSIVVLNIEVAETWFIEISDTIQEGETYSVGNSVYDATGSYLDSLLTTEGCDSIIQLHLVVDPLDKTVNLFHEIDLSYFPNPFSEAFTIQFTLPEAQKVSLDIFDVRGLRVYEVMEPQRLKAGTHIYTIDRGLLVPGVYFCQFKVQGEMFTFKVVSL